MYFHCNTKIVEKIQLTLTQLRVRLTEFTDEKVFGG